LCGTVKVNKTPIGLAKVIKIMNGELLLTQKSTNWAKIAVYLNLT
jgi:hypothetical protein